ncbi:MAG: class C sortase, partial [Ruminococcus sp.]|nr:class C sortase [Ruminococcus sp.]
MKKRIVTILSAFFLVLGVGFIAYPFVGLFISDYTSTKVVDNYEAQIKAMNSSEIKKNKDKIIKYNKELKKIGSEPLTSSKKDKERVKVKTAFKPGEIEGYISVPKIDVMLPICEGTSEATLYHAIGHLEGTSLPYGGPSTHCVLTGHSGMANATLFSNLDKLSLNDVFYITVLNETHEYKVDMIKNIKPNEADKYIKIEKNKDYVSLITCAPITINTHRLVVRGHRIKYDGEKPSAKDRVNKNNFIVFFIVLSIITIVFLIIVIRKLIYKKMKK